MPENPAPRIVDEWLALRAQVAALERAEHPDLIDGQGRRWTWWKGDLYRRERCGVPRDFLPEPVTEEQGA